MFPDSVFLQGGQFVELIRSDPETGQLHSCKQDNKLTSEHLNRTLNLAFKDRRRVMKKNKILDAEDKSNYADMAIFRYLYDIREPIESEPFIKVVS
jgi:hypothetical protein